MKVRTQSDQNSNQQASSVLDSTTAAGGDVQHPRRFEATDPMEDQAAFFNTHGYCFVENALAGSELKAAQDASWRVRWSLASRFDEVRARWAREGRGG